MKRLYYLLFTISFLSFSEKIWATHSAGGELIYALVPGTTNTYQFTFKFYRDCGAVGQSTSTEPASFTLCYSNSCQGGIQQVTMPKIVGNIPTNPVVPNGSPLDNGCQSITTCTDINSTVHGYRQWWYTATVTLPTTCNSWKFWTTLCCRNDITGNITTPPGSQYLYVEVNFDNTVSQNNSSPYFVNSNSISSLPVPYVCINVPYNHTGGAIDPDGDSLVFETIQPRHKTGCNANAPVNILLPAYNILNTAGDPFPTNNTYNLNTTNAFFSFTPTTLGYYVLCQKVSEYRNGVLIGTSMRDMQIVVDVCTPLPVISELDTISIQGGSLSNDTIYTCPESDLYFCFDIIDITNPTANVFHVSDNHATEFPGSTVTFSNPQPNILHVCLDWHSSLSDTGLTKFITVLVNDSLNCVSTPGMVSLPVYIRKSLIAGGDTTMCYGDTTSIWVYGNEPYSWQALPGGDDNTSLSCTNCANPMVWPDKTTDYEVTDLCGFKDTIRINIYPLIDPLPLFTLTPKETTMENPTFTMTNQSLNAIKYAWYDSSHNFLSNSYHLIRTEPKVGHYCYTLEATNFCNYTRASTQCATILGDGYLAYPNAFTPNGDGKNDVFQPIIIGDMLINNYTMVIYNRWGMQMFKTKNWHDGWRGDFKGKECEADTYYYYVEAYHGLNEKLVYKGDFILVR